MKKFVKVPVKYYISLKNSELILDCLESGGVDNWDWYGESLEEFEEFTENDIGLDIIEEE